MAKTPYAISNYEKRRRKSPIPKWVFRLQTIRPRAMLIKSTSTRLGENARLRYTLTPQGPIAQWLEQRTHNPLVPGSSPGGPTTLAMLVTQSFRHFDLQLSHRKH